MTTRPRTERGEGTEPGRAAGPDGTPEGRRSGRSGSQAGLRRALRANAAFSAASGLAIGAAAPVLPDLLGAGTTTLYLVIGIFLVAFAIRLVLLARSEDIARSEALVIVAGDWGWVLGSAVVMGMGLLTTLGSVLVGATAGAVAGFAVWQGRNLPARGEQRGA